jgi:hypothetical protein
MTSSRGQQQPLRRSTVRRAQQQQQRRRRSCRQLRQRRQQQRQRQLRTPACSFVCSQLLEDVQLQQSLAARRAWAHLLR